MIREYYVRGERRTVEEVDDIVAVKLNRDVHDGLARMIGDRGTESSAEPGELPDATRAAFASAQWFFVEAGAAPLEGLHSSTADGVDDAGKLIRRRSGRFGIVTRRLTVQLTEDLPDADVERALAERGLRVLTRLRFAPHLFDVEAGGHPDALAASADLHDDPRFTLAEPSVIEHVPERRRPTDPLYRRQWQWANTGQKGGRRGADIRAEAAWNLTRGAGMRLAVIDTGFHAAHEDLRAGVGSASGYFRRVHGDAVSRFVRSTAGMPAGDHGTLCAGMAGARQDNGRGGCGAAPECELILIACLPDHVGTQTTLARAVAYAADPRQEIVDAAPDDGADVLVVSLGPNEAAWDLTVALDLALRFAATNGRGGRGLAIFWAASNGEVDVLQDEVASHDDVIAVVRSTNADMDDKAARGPEVELIAPGVDVLSTTGDGGYGTATGTSYAAPCAAGCAALALSVNRALTRDELRRIMRASADKIGGVGYDENGHHDDYGYGRVNAEHAVRLALDSVSTAPSGTIGLGSHR